MALFNRKALENYLRTGDYTPSAVPAEDMSLAEHDARWHPHGYKEGDRCLFRANLDKGDKTDADVANATPKEGGISGIFTGSAADYSKPSLLKVGTGEGSQVYGWGLYGSTERGVAEGYADNYDSDIIKYLGSPPPAKIADFVEKNLKVHHGDIDATVQDLSDALFPPFKEAAQWLKDNKGSIRYTRKDTPHLYEQTFFTNRAPGDESHLLKWYEPVSEEQMKWINRQAKLENLENLDYLEGFLDRHPGTTAHNIYSRLWDALGSPQKVSEFLYRAGIDGIKYPVDSFGGKTIKDGNKAGWNYVSFSDDNIRVDRKWRDGEEVDDAARTKIERYLALDASPLDPDFEFKHPRGNSGNKGQFRKSAKTLAKLDEADAALQTGDFDLFNLIGNPEAVAPMSAKEQSELDAAVVEESLKPVRDRFAAFRARVASDPDFYAGDVAESAKRNKDFRGFIDDIGKVIAKHQQTIDDWAGRAYRQSDKSVDVRSRDETGERDGVSVNLINESRRRRRIESERRAIDKLEKSLEDALGADYKDLISAANKHAPSPDGRTAFDHSTHNLN